LLAGLEKQWFGKPDSYTTYLFTQIINPTDMTDTTEKNCIEGTITVKVWNTKISRYLPALFNINMVRMTKKRHAITANIEHLARQRFFFYATGKPNGPAITQSLLRPPLPDFLHCRCHKIFLRKKLKIIVNISQIKHKNPILPIGIIVLIREKA
jgi:hypothetical protein